MFQTILEVYIPTSEIDMKPIIENLKNNKRKLKKEFDKLNECYQMKDLLQMHLQM